jgi:hypothetical protein
MQKQKQNSRPAYNQLIYTLVVNLVYLHLSFRVNPTIICPSVLYTRWVPSYTYATTGAGFCYTRYKLFNLKMVKSHDYKTLQSWSLLFYDVKSDCGAVMHACCSLLWWFLNGWNFLFYTCKFKKISFNGNLPCFTTERIKISTLDNHRILPSYVTQIFYHHKRHGDVRVDWMRSLEVKLPYGQWIFKNIHMWQSCHHVHGSLTSLWSYGGRCTFQKWSHKIAVGVALCTTAIMLPLMHVLA